MTCEEALKEGLCLQGFVRHLLLKGKTDPFNSIAHEGMCL